MTTTLQEHIRREVRRAVPHMDSSQTAMFSRELEHLIARTYDVKYPHLRAREFIPVDTSVPASAQSFVWRSYDQVGAAKIIANYADDLPVSDVTAKEVAQAIKSLGAAYHFSVDDIMAIAAGTIQIDQVRAAAARTAIETAIDNLAAFGDANHGLPGFLNHPNVPVMGKPDIGGDWSTATAMEILEDLYRIEAEIPTITNTVESPDTLLLPPSLFRRAAQLPLTDLDPDKTALSTFLKNAVNIRNVDQWLHLETAGAGGGKRVVCYHRSPEKLSLVIPMEFTQYPAQARNLSFTVPCMAKIGGVSVKYPMSILYVDGV